MSKPEIPVIRVVMETVSKNLIGTKTVDMKRIEIEDDGSFTVVLPWYTGPQEDEK